MRARSRLPAWWLASSSVVALAGAVALAAAEWGAPLERFTVFGGSKRGWTTWLLAAVEPRVTALAPIVIDAHGAFGERAERPHRVDVDEEHDRLAGGVLVPLRDQQIAHIDLRNARD